MKNGIASGLFTALTVAIGLAVAGAVIWWFQFRDLVPTQKSKAQASVAAAPVEQQGLLQQVIAACPGLRRYSDDWEFVGVNEPGDEVEVKVSDNLQKMPLDYYATGHTCLFKLGEDGPGSVGTYKRPCVSACLDEASQVDRSTYIRVN